MMYVGSECTHRKCRPCAEKTLISQKWPSKEIFKNRKFKAEYFKTGCYWTISLCLKNVSQRVTKPLEIFHHFL